MTGMGSHQRHTGATDVWLTPPAIIEALGGSGSFDLDPCSPIDRPWDTALAHLTEADDGLAQEWSGRVWLNPPYSRNVIGSWLWKMAQHGVGTALIFARTETQVFHRCVWEQADALLFMRGRITFCDPTGQPGKSNSGAPSVFCAYGKEDVDRLAESGIPGSFVPIRASLLIFGTSFDVEKIKTWNDAVAAAMERLGNQATLGDLYRALADTAKAKANRHYREKIRQTLQQGPFERVDRGVWKAAQ